MSENRRPTQGVTRIPTGTPVRRPGPTGAAPRTAARPTTRPAARPAASQVRRPATAPQRRPASGSMSVQRTASREAARIRAERERRRKEKIVIIGVIALVVIVAIVIALIAGGGKKDVPAVSQATLAPTAEIELTAEPTAEPTSEPTPSPTPVNDVADPIRAANRPKAVDTELPVFRNANTTEKIIAITVDDCFQVENVRGIVDCAIQNDAKLTIFPLGKMAIRSDLAAILRYAWENGMELENHTYDHSGLYNVTDEELAYQVYNQNLALSNALGMEYQCHFLRPRGGDAKNDERVHAYINQLGYKGVAHWNTSGSGSDQKSLMKTLAPGNIYLFHTTDEKDYAKLLWFIPYAKSQGYELVTLNEMFGYPANETRPLEKPIEEYVAPTLAPYESEYLVMKAPTYDYRAYRLQQALIDLGYLEYEPDGVYGQGTAELVRLFQQDQGMEPTGVADVATQQRLFALAENAAKGPHPTVRPRPSATPEPEA